MRIGSRGGLFIDVDFLPDNECVHKSSSVNRMSNRSRVKKVGLVRRNLSNFSLSIVSRHN